MSDKKALFCFVCTNKYNDPMILNCGHTFCAACLDRGKVGNKVKCPICHNETPASSITSNMAVKHIIEEAKVKDKLLLAQYIVNQKSPYENKPTVKKSDSEKKKDIYHSFNSKDSFESRFSFLTNLPAPIQYVEVKDRFYLSKNNNQS